MERKTIDKWPVAGSGLPTRVVNSTRAANISTVGQLRDLTDPQLRALHGMGAGSVRKIRRFFRTCTEIESGKKLFIHGDDGPGTGGGHLQFTLLFQRIDDEATIAGNDGPS